MLEFDVLFGRYEMGTSPQNLYEGCDLEAIAGDALRTPNTKWVIHEDIKYSVLFFSVLVHAFEFDFMLRT